MLRELTGVLVATVMASSLATNAYAAYGRTAGAFDVSPNGGAQYSIPIWVPPGIMGIQPQLVLTYDSQRSYGMMGPGWQLSGLSAVTRCNATLAQNGGDAAITLTDADFLCLDGNFLRYTSHGSTSGTNYQTEIANFSNVVLTGLPSNGYFTVQGKDGLTYEYGNTKDSKILPISGTAPYIWALDKVTDRSGNFMTFTYYQAGGSYVPLSMQYTAMSGTTTFPYQINFGYTTKSATDQLTRYLAGSQIQQTEQLSTITVKSSGTTVREYKLLYTTSTATLRATLTSIQECGGSAGTDCLPATTVGYQYGTAGIGNPTAYTGSGATNGTVYTADLDGDGKEDLIFAATVGSNYIWYAQFATATGYGPSVPVGVSTTGTSTFLIDHFDATAGVQIMAAAGGAGSLWYSYKWNPTTLTFDKTPTTLTVPANVVSYSSADVDGDGLPDVVYITKVGTSVAISVQFNNSTTGAVSFNNAPTIGYQAACAIACAIYGNNQLQNSPVKHFDFDGDGRQDLIFTGATGPRGGYVYALLSRGKAGFVLGTTTGAVPGFAPLMAVNWNDDRCTDLVVSQYVIVFPCNGSQESFVTLPGSPVAALDWDGDGRTDVIVPGTAGAWNVVRSQGTSTIAAAQPTGMSVGAGKWIITDRDGDGLDDLIWVNTANANALYVGLHNGADIHPDLATSFTDGYGLAVKPSYVSMAQNYAVYGTVLNDTTYMYFSGNGATYPYRDYIGPIHLVTTATYTDPTNLPSGTYTQTYYYKNAWLNLQGRGYAGLREHNVLDSRTGWTLYAGQHQDFPYTGFPTGPWYTAPNGYSAFQRNHTLAVTVLDSTANNQRYFPYWSDIFDTTKEITASGADAVNTRDTTYTYDNYGNATNITTTLTDTNPTSPYLNETSTSAVVNSYSPSLATWCLGLPTQSTVTNSASTPGGAAITRTVAYTPDYTNCRQSAQTVEPFSSTYNLTKSYGYNTSLNPAGNLTYLIVSGAGIATSQSTLYWSNGTSVSVGQFPEQVYDPMQIPTFRTFDPNNGTLKSLQDGNGTVTSWTYDNFARKISESRPDGTSTAWTYNSCGTTCVNANNKMTVTETVSNKGGGARSTRISYLDALDRVLVTSSTMLNGAYDRNEVQYDNLGNLHKQAAPCTLVGCTTYWTTNTYDVLHRITESSRQANANSSTLANTIYTYSGDIVTVLDPLQHTTTYTRHPTGTLGRSQGPNGYYQQYSYDAFGSLLSVMDSAANKLFTATYDYGIDAFQTNATDMDLDVSTLSGQHRQYTYDALGEVTHWTDAKGQSFSATYDAVGRQVTRTEPDLATTWQWGVNGFGSGTTYDANQLDWVQAVGPLGTYRDTYTYDVLGRPSTKTLALPGDASYVYTATYNATTGLLDTLQYPLSTAYQLKLQYGYANGILKSITDFNAAATVFWTANLENPMGQVTQETFGNGVVSTHVFDALTGLLSTVAAGPGGGAALQNNSFTYDAIGNVTQRQDGKQLLTENFFYDNMNRLDHSTLGGSTINLQMHYDTLGMGNIASRSDVAAGAAWTYDPVKKHAVTQAGSSAFTYTYDANGNALTRNGNAITWTSYNYPSDINAAGESVQFWYGPDHQRWKTLYTSSTTTEYTYHVDKLMEKVVSGGVYDYRHYIYAGSELVGIYSRTSAGANTMRYVLADHEGSFTNIDTGSGPATNYVSESFTAFGNRRNGQTWSGPVTAADQTAINAVSRHGYAGETALGAMGLNHLNGRVEDAITGRFLSPDPVIQNPSDTQNFNRYSYVNNNPLSFIDPSGFDGESLPEQTVTGTRPNDGGGAGGGGGGNWGGLDFWNWGHYGSPPLTPEQRQQQAAGLLGVHSLPSISGDLANGNAFNTVSIYSDISATTGWPVNDIRTDVGPAAADSSVENEIDGITVTARRENSGSFNFGGIGRDARFRSYEAAMNVAAAGVILSANFMLGGSPAAADVALGTRGAAGLSDSALVVRGGGAANQAAGRIAGVIGPSRTPGVSGFSVQCNGGTCLSELGQFLRNKELGVTTVGEIRAIGGDVISTPGFGYHATVTGLSGEAASPLFRIVTNPNPLVGP